MWVFYLTINDVETLNDLHMVHVDESAWKLFHRRVDNNDITKRKKKKINIYC